MEYINKILRRIQPLDANAMQSVRQTLCDRSLGGRLGCLEDMLIKYAGITRSPLPTIPKKKTIIVCSDHGVAQMCVSAYPPETTVEMTRNYLINRGAVANALSNFAHSDLSVVDVGINADTTAIPQLLHRKIAFGTENIAKGPAMRRQDAIAAVKVGIKLAEQYIAEGYRCLLPGEMGIANTTSSAAIVAVCGDLPAELATGRGTNISDARLKQKIAVVRQALTVNRPDKNDGFDILSKVGGFEFGCIAGLILGAAANRAVVMLDGFNTGAAALIARAICPGSTHYLIGSHLAAEQAHQTMLQLLNIQPYMDMQLRLGEATGSSIAINLLDSAIRLLNAKPERLLPMPLKPAVTAVETNAEPLPIDQAAQAACALYIDNLAKPLHSLGRLEELAIQIASITRCTRPHSLKKAFLYLTASSAPLPQTAVVFARHAGASLFALHLGQSAAACDIAHFIDELTAHFQLIALTTNALADSQQTAALLQTACRHIAAGRAAIITDSRAVLSAAAADDTLADYIIAAGRPDSLLKQHGKRQLGLTPYLSLNVRPDSGIGAALTLKLIDASLHMLNDMKTFGSTGVSTAKDGPGVDRQSEKI